MTPAPTTDPSLPQTAGIYELIFGEDQRYTLSLPAEYDGRHSVPLILALHYGGTVTPWYGRGVLEILVEPGLRELGAIIVSPDARRGSWTKPEAETDVLALLDYVIANYNIDTEKTLITGYSMGGMGTWYLAARNQDRFAAAIPIAGVPQVNTRTTIWEIPLYVIHSSADELIDIRDTGAAVEALKAQGYDVTFVSVGNLSHYQTEQYAPLLRDAVPWVQAAWGE